MGGTMQYTIRQGKRRGYQYDVLIYLDGALVFRGSFTGERISAADKKLFAAFKAAVKALNEKEAG